MARSLAVLGESLQRLANQVNITLIYVEAQQPETPGGAPTNTVQELESLTHQVVVGFVVLVTQKVLDWKHKHRQKSVRSQVGQISRRV